MAKQTSVNLDITVTGSDGYSIGGGGTAKRTLTVSGSDITIVGLTGGGTIFSVTGSNQLTFYSSGASSVWMNTPTASTVDIAGTNIFQVFDQPQVFNAQITIRDGTQANGLVLGSDVNGATGWIPIPSPPALAIVLYQNYI